MAATVTFTNKGVAGNRRVHSGSMNLGVYATGGVPFTPSTFGLWRLDDVALPSIGLLTGAVRQVAIDWPNQKIMAFDATGTQITASTDLSAMSLRFSARGTG